MNLILYNDIISEFDHPSNMKIIQYLHAAILVSDLDRAEHFYGTILGLTKAERPLNFPGTWYQIGPCQLHLIVAPEVPSDMVNLEKWGRNRHLAFSVDNLESVKAKLMAANYEFQMSASGRSALFTKDSDGNLIELNQA